MGRLKRWTASALAACVFCLTGATAFAKVTPLPTDDSGGMAWSEANAISKTEYKDESIHVTVERDAYKNIHCTIVYVTVADPSQIRTAMSGSGYDDERYVATKLLSKHVNAVAAVNGDYFKYNDIGFLVRQGTTYRERADGSRDVLLIDDQGDFHTLKSATMDDVNAYLASMEAGRTVVNSFNFGPILVLDGEAQEITSSLFQASDKQQRVALLQLGKLEYAIFHCEGKYNGTLGLTMRDFANAIVKLVPQTKVAYNLDGGGSAHVVFQNRQLNDNDGGRDICDIVYFASAYEP